MKDAILIYLLFNSVIAFLFYWLGDYKLISFQKEISGIMPEIARNARPYLYLALIIVGVYVLIKEIWAWWTFNPKSFFRYEIGE